MYLSNLLDSLPRKNRRGGVEQPRVLKLSQTSHKEVLCCFVNVGNANHFSYKID